MKTKGFKRFEDRLRYFRTDMEVCEVILMNKELLKGEGNLIFPKVNELKHPILFNRNNNPNSRKLVLCHLKKSIYVSFIKEMYEEVTEYLRYILKEATMNGADTDRIVGEHNVKMKANDILTKGTKREIVEAIMDQIFQQLENEKSTLELITKIKNKLGLNVTDEIIQAALPYLKIRHIFVHSDGKPNQEFKEKYPDIALDRKERIALSSEFAIEAYNTVLELMKDIDQDMLNKNYISSSERME